MRAHIAGLLALAAFAPLASEAVPWGIFHRQASTQLPPNNATAITPYGQDETTRSVAVPMAAQSTTLPLTSSLFNATNHSSLRTNVDGGHVSTSSSSSYSQPSKATARSEATTSSSQPIKSSTTRTSAVFTVGSETSQRVTVSAPNRVKHPLSTPSDPDLVTTPAGNTTSGPGSATTPSYQPSISTTSLTLWNSTQTPNRTTTATSTGDSESCTELMGDEPVTEYSIVYTATITLSGNYSNYTPPYPTIETPTYCGIGVTLSGEPFLTTIAYGTGGFIVSTKQPAATCSAGSSFDDCSSGDDSKAADSYRGKINPTASSRVTVTFVTTDKNPATVTASEAAPGFGVTGSVGFSVQQHRTADPGEGGSGGEGRVNGPQSQQKQTTSQPMFTITAMADNIIINDKTFSSLRPDQSTTVTVNQGTFTILPTAVVGEGATVNKPQPARTAISILTPVTTIAGGLPVVVSGSEAVVDGTTFEIPPMGTTATIHNQQVTAGPGQVVIDDQTITFRAAGGPQSDVVVTGAEMVTAIGQSIFVHHSTTLTYGPGIPETTEVVDDDTITIGPSGVVLHGTTIGGITAKATSTRYEIAGGATITKLSPSFVVIDGTTFTAGSKGKEMTKVIGGETITIGPKGVSIDTMTLSLPFGSSTVTTIKASATRTDSLPTETGGSKNKNGGGNDSGSENNEEDEDEDNMGSVLEPNLVAGITGICIAIGVWVWL